MFSIILAACLYDKVVFLSEGVIAMLGRIWGLVCCWALLLAAPTVMGRQGAIPLGLPTLAVPADNPMTPAKVALGKALFGDKRLSADRKVSCAACHDPLLAFGDGRAVAKGIRGLTGVRNVPTIVNAAYSRTQFWDGRRMSLEEQVGDPFVNAVEHGLADHEAVLKVVRNDPGYRAGFRRAFPGAPAAITMGQVGKAIAAYERTLIAGNSPFDRYQYGGDRKALSLDALRGLELFRGRARCESCHHIGERNALFTDDEFHRLGVGHHRVESRLGELAVQFMQSDTKDIGKALIERPELSELGRFLVTLSPDDIGRFKTPTLRNVAATGPYMHDGSVGTLEAAVEMEIYYRGLEAGRPLILTPREKDDLVAFLRSLTSPQFGMSTGYANDAP